MTLTAVFKSHRLLFVDGITAQSGSAAGPGHCVLVLRPPSMGSLFGNTSNVI